MNKRRLFTRMLQTLALVMTSTLLIGEVYTFAAYKMHEEHKQSINVNMDYSSYFGGGNGSAETPYKITNAQQLRNLSYLVNLGVFTAKDHFRLSTFTYDNIPLNPIGTMDSPFHSHLDGLIDPANTLDPKVAVIENLLIEGKNVSDVGMFGYVANDGYIGHFILKTPTVKVTGDRGYSYATLDKNPLRSLFTDADLRAISITPNTYITNDKPASGMTKFTVTLPTTLPKTNTVDGKNVPLNYSFEISNQNYLELVSSNADTGTYVFQTKATPNPNGYDFKKNPGEYFTLTFKVDGFNKVTDPNGDLVNRYGTYTIERFKFYYDDKIDAIVSEATDPRFYNKTCYPSLRQDKISDTNIEYTDNTRAIFVGIVAGRLDGVADWIGASKPVMDIQRPFISNSLLVGKAIDDDAARSLSKEEMNVANNYKGKNSLTYGPIPAKMTNFTDSSGNLLPNTDRYIDENLNRTPSNNRIVTDIYGRENSFTTPAIDTLRVHATNTTVKRRPESLHLDEHGHPMTEDVVMGNVTAFADENGQFIPKGDVALPENTATGSFNTISFQNDRTLELYAPVKSIFSSNLYGYNSMKISNAISFWISVNDNSGWLQRLIASDNNFYLTFEIDYMFFDDDPNMANADAYSSKCIEIDGIYKATSKLNTSGIGNYPAYYKFDNAIGHGFDRYDYSVPNKPVQIPTRVRTSNETDTDVTMDNVSIVDSDNPNNRNIRKTALGFSHDEWAGPCAAADDPTLLVNKQVQKKKIRLQPNKSFFNLNQLANNHQQQFYLGMFDNDRGLIYGENYQPPAEPVVRTPYRFDILGIKVIISDIYGNMESTIGTIDFIEDGNLNNIVLPVSNNIFTHSKKKVSAKTLQNTITSTSAPATPFVAVHSEASSLNSGGYHISVNRSGTSNVTVTWSIDGIASGNLSKLTYINPKDNLGFSPATYSPKSKQN